MFSLLKRHREVIVVGALLLYPFITFLTRGHRGREMNFVDRAVIGVTSPIQRAITWAGDGIGAGVSSYVALRGVRAHNAELERVNSELRAEVNALRESKAENERLRKMLEYAEYTPEKEIAAPIIGVNPSSIFFSVRIGRGEDDGVRAGMPVITRDGIVGRVQRATGSYADVVMITDPLSKVAVTLQRTRVRATAAGIGGAKTLSLAKTIALENVLRTEDVEEGDLVVTSGTDGVFPKGLVVGRVTSVLRNESGMFLSAGIIPAVEIPRLEEVMVLPVVLSTPVNRSARAAPQETRR